MTVKRMLASAVLPLATWLAVGAAVAPTAQAAAPPDLTVSATFDKASYQTGDTVSATVTVHNAGASAVHNVAAQSDDSVPTQLVLDSHGWGALGTGVTIAAGSSVKVTVSGNQADLTATTVTLSGSLYQVNGNTLATFSFTAPITLRAAPVAGEVFGDANSSGAPDPGEGLAGAKVTLSYYYGANQYTATTDSSGHFSFPTVPTALYDLAATAPHGWNVIPRFSFAVPTSGLPDLQLRAVRPLGNQLHAALHFTKHVYHVGDLAHVIVTLTNGGSTPLRGITEECDHVGDADELTGMTSGWGQLRESAGGVALGARQTRTFDVTETVPAGAYRAGEVFVACDFGYSEVQETDRPVAHDSAKVPGAVGAFAGRVFFYPHGHNGPGVGLRGVRAVLVLTSSCPLLKRSATTNAQGQFSFSHLPAGPNYELYVLPPAGWKVIGQNPSPAFVFGEDTVQFAIEVVHGSARLPKVPTGCTSGTSTSGRTTTPISNTGVDAGELGLAGAAALLSGVALLALGRRPRRCS
jgi:uncharacterized repeat protein (TIGR01451 family)